MNQMSSWAIKNPIPIILLSARAGEEARIDGLRAGADEYLHKPYNARELLALARKGLRARGFGEERLLWPLEDRATLLDNPAQQLLRVEKQHGETRAFLTRAELGASLAPEPPVQSTVLAGSCCS